MSEKLPESMVLPNTCAEKLYQLHEDRQPLLLPAIQHVHKESTVEDSQNTKSGDFLEQVIISAGSMQMQLINSPELARNEEGISTVLSTEGEKSSLETVFPTPISSSTHCQTNVFKGKQPRVENSEIQGMDEIPVSHANEILLEQFNTTGSKIDSFLTTTLSYETSSVQGSQMCSLPRQMKMRTDLALSDKVRLIQVSENTGKSQRSLAAEFGISLGSVNNILRRKREYIDAFERNEASGSIKTFHRLSWPSCSTTRHPVSTVTEADGLKKLMCKWIEIAKKKNIPLSGSLLQDKASEFAAKLGMSTGNFTATSSWLGALKKKYNLCFQSEQSDSTGNLYTTWTKMLPYLLQGYEPQDIFTCGETTLLYKGLPDKCLLEGGVCMGTHHRAEVSELSVTVLLCCSAVGEKIKPLVIGKSSMPVSFQNVMIDNLPVVWKYQEKACMTSRLFTEWLRNLDQSMQQQNRHIALFLDMAPGHLSQLLLKNVRLQFYLDNSTSYLQPLQQGIITSFKAHYRKRFLRAVLAWVECSNGSSLATNNMTELDLVFWIKHSWNDVKDQLIVSCFDAVGFPTPPIIEEDSDEGLLLQISELVEECGQAFKFTPMYAKLYVQFDSQIPCHVHEMEAWEEQLLAEAKSGSITIKSEPVDDDFQYSGTGGRGKLSVNDLSNQIPNVMAATCRPIGQNEALQSLNKLKTFSANNPHLLETLYTTEEIMLESIRGHRKQTRNRAMSHVFPVNIYRHEIQ